MLQRALAKTWGLLGGSYVVRSKYSCGNGVTKEKGLLVQKATVKSRELLSLDNCWNKLRLFPENCVWFEIFMHVKMSVIFALFPLL